jgi:hypothetical protein
MPESYHATLLGQSPLHQAIEMEAQPVPHSLMATSLDSKFWSRFAKTTWEQKTLVVKDFQSPLRKIDATEIFRLVVALADVCRKTKSSDGFKFYIDAQRLHADDVLKVLPRKADHTLRGYDARMSRQFKDYALVCDELLKVPWAQHSALSQFMTDLHLHVGLPNRFSEIGLYLGTYRRTPFGVHVDGCGVFSFPVIGHKKFRTWTHAYAAKNLTLQKSFRYPSHVSQSKLHEVGEGDLSYWPSSAWHIAESAGGFSATWSVGVWVDKTHGSTVAEIIANNLKNETAGVADFTPASGEGEVNRLPRAYEKTIAQLAAMTKSQWREMFADDWLRKSSARGLKTSAIVSAPLKKSIEISKLSEPVLWRKNEIGLVLSFAGQNFQASSSAGLLKLIVALNSGRRCVVSDYLKGARKPVDLATLRSLAAAGAFK